MTRVVLLDPAGELETVARALAGHPDLEVQRADALPAGADVVGVLVPPEVAVGAAALAQLPGVRIVAATATGFDHLDTEAIAAAGAWATHCPGYCDEEVAEHAIAFVVALLRGLVLLDRTARQGIWDQTPSPPRRVAGSRLGIVGLGRIGRAVARRAAGLEMRVVAYDPLLTDGGGVELVGLDELLERSDAITLHALLTPETREMLGARELARCKPGAYLVNCARAALVDHAALGAALHAGHLGGCALDVLPTEPPPAGEPAFGWPRTVITPHSAWYSPESATAPYRMAAEAVAAVLDGREPYAALARPAAR
ncbi:MAG TPA: NAD(P)-dependent oxidoreductase [Solirubrobacteraceae bacterium]|jgi:D-3-phosphoglycerate dehydrogenase|nr:NAD(P)-dependent oxidoreductase [Solirubrobacteraceae bacterium]